MVCYNLFICTLCTDKAATKELCQPLLTSQHTPPSGPGRNLRGCCRAACYQPSRCTTGKKDNVSSGLIISQTYDCRRVKKKRRVLIDKSEKQRGSTWRDGGGVREEANPITKNHPICKTRWLTGLCSVPRRRRLRSQGSASPPYWRCFCEDQRQSGGEYKLGKVLSIAQDTSEHPDCLNR